MQGGHGSPARRGSPLDQQETRIPGEVARPALPARIEEWHDARRLGVWGMCFRILVTVTCRARPREFVHSVARSPHSGQNVFADIGRAGVTGGMPAVLAAVPGTSAHL